LIIKRDCIKQGGYFLSPQIPPLYFRQSVLRARQDTPQRTCRFRNNQISTL